MIEVRGLEKRYGRFDVLKGVDLTISAGHIVGLAGPNACGKTTLIKAILGLVIPDKGQIKVGEYPAKSVNAREVIGYMPQNAEFPLNLTPRELFQLLSEIRRKTAPRRDELIERFGVGQFLKKPCGVLSTGTRQKISAIAAIMFEPKVLILDEPTAGFDPVSAAIFKELIIGAAKRGATVLIVSHIMSELEQLIDDLVFMLEGEVWFSGSVAELKNRADVQTLEQGIVKLMSQRSEIVARDHR